MLIRALGVIGLIQAPLFDDHILADDEAMRRHLPQFGKHASDMFIGVDKCDYDRQVPTSLHQVSCAHTAATLKAGERVVASGTFLADSEAQLKNGVHQ